MNEALRKVLKRLHYPLEVMLTCVRWYGAYPLSRLWCKQRAQLESADLTAMPKRKTIDELFKGCHFEHEIIILCVRWYLRYKLSSRDLVEMMAERGLTMSHTTILRWVQRFVPEFEKRWNQYAAGAGSAWRVDETYVKIKGQWVYLYRAVDRHGRTVDSG